MRKLFIFCFLISLLSSARGQTIIGSQTYVNKSIDGYIHLYYDQQYFLVDEDCEYKTYTRVTKFDKENGCFNGFFTDYYNNGKTYLTGNFTKGKKDGNFKGFYPSGKPKYDIYFKDDQETGVWEYYYESGNLWYQIEFKNKRSYINNYFNNYGQLLVKEGKGKFFFTEKASGFNEYGYNSIVYNGRVKNGLPAGNWSTFLEYDNQNQELIGTELYSNGKFQVSNYYFPDRLPANTSLIRFYPTFIEDNATLFTYKNCTIDDNQGFSFYLQNEINKALSLFVLTDNISSETFTVSVAVNERGRSTKITIPDEVSSQLKTFTKRTLEKIAYWIPSYKNRETISDTLKITLELTLDQNEKPFINYPIIEREKGR
jgi:antitoxin component YwqK of YwqJK toxin-antitoxin module